MLFSMLFSIIKSNNHYMNPCIDNSNYKSEPKRIIIQQLKPKDIKT